MRNAAGEEMAVPLKATIAFDDPEAMCQAAVLGLGVTQIAMAHALRHLESGALVRLVPQWYADEAFRRQRLAERFARARLTAICPTNSIVKMGM